MNFEKFIEEFNRVYGSDRPADVAKEFNVSPQVVNNWKLRQQVPYKYSKLLNELKNQEKKTINPANFFSQFPAEMNKSDDSIDILAFIRFFVILIYKNRLKLFGWVLISLLLANIKYSFEEPLYQSSAKILPIVNNQGSSKVSSIASQFGINLSSSDASLDLSSPQLIPDIINSRRMYNSLLVKKFKQKEKNNETALYEILSDSVLTKLDENSMGYRKLISKLSKSISITRYAKNSPLLLITCTFPDPVLAKSMVDEIILSLKEVLNDFKLIRLKQKKAFIENRLNSALNELTEREERLKEFREKNRNIITSPSLKLQSERLMRDSEVQQQIFITLKNQFEIVQIDMVGKDDVLQILDSAQLPMNKISPVLAIYLFFGLFTGVFLGIIHILYKNYESDIFEFFKILN